MTERPLVIVSNRGPVSFELGDDGTLGSRRGGGGLVTALAPAVHGTGAVWVAGAMSEADRRAAGAGQVDAEGFHLRLLPVADERYRAYYDVFSSSVLWFLHHGLFDLPRQPRFDRHLREAWTAYRDVNATFARAVAESAPDGAAVLVHDYHLTLLAPLLRRERPDVVPVHFHHTPFAGPDTMRVLPAAIAEEMFEGLVAHTACGFHSRRWAAAFEASSQDVLGRAPSTFVAPAAAHPDDIGTVAKSAECERDLESLAAAVGDRLVVARVDRIELSKNLLRGFWAFDRLLEQRPDLRGQVVFVARVYPSRERLAAYQAYRQEVEGLAARVNDRWASGDWQPILVDSDDAYSRSVALLRRYDALLVNPVRDGLNLVAKEGPLVNERDGAVVLSRESGVWDELGEQALGINPFDVEETADALGRALDMATTERAERARGLRAVATGRTPDDWLADQLAAAGT